MAKYSVLIPCTCSILFEIDAESPEDAKQNALDSDFHLEVFGSGDLHEFEVHEHVCKGNVFYGVLNSVEVDLIDDSAPPQDRSTTTMSKPTSSLAELRDQIRLSVYGPGGSEQSEAADCIETAKLLVAILDRLEKVERQLAVLVENTSTENVHD